MGTAAPRSLYIYSRRRDSKARPLFILLGITPSYKEIMADGAQIMDKKPALLCFIQLTVNRLELINMLSVSPSCLFSQPLPMRSFFRA